MVTNTVNFDIHTDHNIEKALEFYTVDLPAYQRYFYDSIINEHLNLIIPKFIGFETGDNCWAYKDKGWITIVSAAEKLDTENWDSLYCEVQDAKTV